MKIGNWNVRTLYTSGNIVLAAKEITTRGIDIIGIRNTLDRTGKSGIGRRRNHHLHWMTTTTGKA